jgi:TonB family protein
MKRSIIAASILFSMFSGTVGLLSAHAVSEDYLDSVRDKIYDKADVKQLYVRTKDPKFSVRIHEDGGIEDLKIVESSGDAAFDELVLGWVKNAAPYAPPPGGPIEFAWDFKWPADYGPYMRSLQREIKKHWKPPSRDSSKFVSAVFKVARDGTISDVSISRSSGDRDEDAAALRAIRESNKLALPKGSPKTVDISFEFDYNVWRLHATVVPANTKQKVPAAILRALQTEIERTVTCEPAKEKSVQVFLNVAAGGTLSSIQVRKSSGDARFDLAAVNGIKKCFPLKKVATPSAVQLICTLVPVVPKRPEVAEKRPPKNTPLDFAILNNQGVKALTKNQFEEAISLFLEALNRQPNYAYARENLSIAYNNWALKKDYPEACKLFYRALYLQPSPTTEENLLHSLKRLGTSCQSSSDHLKAARGCVEKGEFIGAVVHCRLAQKKEPNAEAASLAKEVAAQAESQLLAIKQQAAKVGAP